MSISSIIKSISSADNDLYAGARKSKKLPHILTTILLPPLILVGFSLIGGIIVEATMPEKGPHRP
jgi:hypothetical protein